MFIGRTSRLRRNSTLTRESSEKHVNTSGGKDDNSANTSACGTTLVFFLNTSPMIFRITQVVWCLYLLAIVDGFKVDEKILTQFIKLTSSSIKFSSKTVDPARSR